MQKIIINILTVSILAISAKAQFSLGFKGGYMLSQVYFLPVRMQEPVSGLTGGFCITYVSEPHVGVTLECDFIQKGFRELYSNTSSYSRLINYIEVPFLSHFYIGSNKNRIIIHAGVYAGYSLNGTEQWISETNVQKTYIFSDSSDYRFDYGLQGGVGYERHTKIGAIRFEARVSQALQNSIKPPPLATRERNWTLSQYLSISLCYFFPSFGQMIPNINTPPK